MNAPTATPDPNAPLPTSGAQVLGVIGVTWAPTEDEKRIYEWLKEHYPRICEHYRAGKHLVAVHREGRSVFVDTVLECILAHVGRELVNYILNKHSEGDASTDAESLVKLLEATYGPGDYAENLSEAYGPIVAHRLGKHAHLNDIDPDLPFVITRFLQIENFIRDLTRETLERVEEIDEDLHAANS